MSFGQVNATITKLYQAADLSKDNYGSPILASPNETLDLEGWFEENRACGSWFYYHPNGQLQCKGIRNGKDMVGIWSWFDADGKPQTAGSTLPETEPRPSDLPPNPADVLVKETAPKK
jgi:hypothetical protein